jgi:hypothetical protein
MGVIVCRAGKGDTMPQLKTEKKILVERDVTEEILRTGVCVIETPNPIAQVGRRIMICDESITTFAKVVCKYRNDGKIHTILHSIH